MAVESARRWIEESAYCRELGVEVRALDAESARLGLPYRDENSNGDKALHGGVAASLAALGAQAVARAALGDDALPTHTTALQVAYLSAALGEEVVSEARLLRRGKELCFVEVAVSSADGRPVARGLASVRGRFGDPEAESAPARGDDGEQDPGPMGPFIGRIPFMKRLGIRVEHMTGGRSRIVMPWSERNGDAAGGVHEGALLALLDTTGAMAAWAESGPGRFKASTPAMQAHILAPPVRGDLVAYGRCVHRDRESYLADVEVAHADGGRLVAVGSVNYRIVRPDDAR